MQQVGAKGFAAAQAIDPSQLPVPVPLNELSRRARSNLSRAWVLHRRLMVRLVAAGMVVVGGAALYQGRESIGSGIVNVLGFAQIELAKAGFGIAKINISGQVLTSEQEIVKALGIGPMTSTLNFDADAARDRLLMIPTIGSVTIRKIYPGELSVLIDEKVPVARWRIGEATYLVDANGSPVAQDDGTFRELPLVVGEGANDDAIVMLMSLDRHPVIRENLAALSRIGDRRWDLIFYSGLRVQLPETGVAQALDQLDMYQATDQLLDRDVTVIDLRVPGMVSLKLGELAQAAWAADLKKNKHTTKGSSEYEMPAEQRATGATGTH